MEGIDEHNENNVPSEELFDNQYYSKPKKLTPYNS